MTPLEKQIAQYNPSPSTTPSVANMTPLEKQIAQYNPSPSTNTAILPGQTQVTQDFGTYNPIEPTEGNLAGDTNFAANPNTPVSLPKGSWYIQNAYNQANPQGAPGDYTNAGYGNDVIAQNTQTGEKLHFLHLAAANVKPGDIVSGNTVVGMTGDSGNSTGPNLGVEYYDPSGKIGDVLSSPYKDAFAIH